MGWLGLRRPQEASLSGFKMAGAIQAYASRPATSTDGLFSLLRVPEEQDTSPNRIIPHGHA